jgi:hypothetical protein
MVDIGAAQARVHFASLRGEDHRKVTDLVTRGRYASILRMTVCLMSFGFAFPHALMESEDAAKLLAKQQAAMKDPAREP